MRDHLGNPFQSGRPEFDRGVILMDDCEGTFTYVVEGTGGDDVHEYATAAAWTGTKGLHLQTRTTGAAADDYIGVLKGFSPPNSGLLVARLRVAKVTGVQIKDWSLRLRYYNGSRYYLALLRRRPNTPETAVVTTAGAYAAQAAGAVSIPNLAWVDVELVVDLKTQKYLSARFAGIDLPVAGVAMQDAGASTDWYCCAQLLVAAIGANPAAIYADNLYVGEYLEL